MKDKKVIKCYVRKDWQKDIRKMGAFSYKFPNLYTKYWKNLYNKKVKITIEEIND